MNTEFFKVIVIGAGQAGLSAGYYLKKYNIPFLILDANERVGDSWRNRWDSLRLFTPAKFNSIAGMKFPAPPNYFPTKDEMGDYLEDYAAHFNLPVRTRIKVEGLSREGNIYCIRAGEKEFQAEHVIIAMSNYQNPKIPRFAEQLNKDIKQIHSFYYRHPSQLNDGDVLVAGAGNSGSEIALELARNKHKVWLSGRDTGHLPFDIKGAAAQLILMRIVIRFLFYRVITTGTPIGRKAYPVVTSKGGPLIRNKPKDFVNAGIQRLPKINRVVDGLPVTEDNKIIDVKNIVWCTGFYPAFSWIDIPIFNGKDPKQYRGVVNNEPGLYFLGLHFLYALSSAMVHGVSRDAKYVVNTIRNRLDS
jgi:putative flavoprotein involved in K+ transport